MEPHRIRLRSHWLNAADQPGPAPGWSGPGTYRRHFGQPPLSAHETLWLVGAEFTAPVDVRLNGTALGTWSAPFALRIENLHLRNELVCAATDSGTITLEIRSE
jgi:hypothetical protein